MTLVENRDDAATRLEQLRRQRGATMLDAGVVPDGLVGELDAIEQQIAALDDARVEEVRREREAQTDADAARLAAARDRLTDAEVRRLDAVGRMGAAAQAFAQAARDAWAASRDANEAIAVLGGRRPTALETLEFERRLSERLCTELKSAVGRNGYKFGVIDLRPLVFAQPGQDWRAVEESIGSVGLAPFLNINSHEETAA